MVNSTGERNEILIKSIYIKLRSLRGINHLPSNALKKKGTGAGGEGKEGQSGREGQAEEGPGQENSLSPKQASRGGQTHGGRKKRGGICWLEGEAVSKQEG